MSECDQPELLQTYTNESNIDEITCKQTENVNQITKYVGLMGINNEVTPLIDVNHASSNVNNKNIDELPNCRMEYKIEILSESVEKNCSSGQRESATQTDEWHNDINLDNVVQDPEGTPPDQDDNTVLDLLQELGQTISDINTKMKKNTMDESLANMPKLKNNQLLLPRISTSLETNALAIVTAALVANDKELKDITPQLILSLYCGMFNIYLAFLHVPSIVRYLLREGYSVSEVSIEEWTTRMSLLRKGVNHIVAHFVGEHLNLLTKLSWTLMGPHLCLLGHKPNKSNIHYWGNKMLRTFYTETNLPKERHNVLFHPSLRFCDCLTYILENMCEMRRHMFFVVYNTASTVPRLPGAVCRLAIEQLRGEGLLDFILIDQYLLVQNPFSLLLNSIAKHVSILLEAYEKYMEFGHLAPWCTVIATSEELKIFKHPAIKFVAAVARGLAIRKGVTVLEDYFPAMESDEINDTIEKAMLLLKEIRVQQPNETNNEEKISDGSNEGES